MAGFRARGDHGRGRGVTIVHGAVHRTLILDVPRLALPRQGAVHLRNEGTQVVLRHGRYSWWRVYKL